MVKRKWTIVAGLSILLLTATIGVLYAFESGCLP